MELQPELYVEKNWKLKLGILIVCMTGVLMRIISEKLMSLINGRNVNILSLLT